VGWLITQVRSVYECRFNFWPVNCSPHKCWNSCCLKVTKPLILLIADNVFPGFQFRDKTTLFAMDAN